MKPEELSKIEENARILIGDVLLPWLIPFGDLIKKPIENYENIINFAFEFNKTLNDNLKKTKWFFLNYEKHSIPFQAQAMYLELIKRMKYLKYRAKKDGHIFNEKIISIISEKILKE